MFDYISLKDVLFFLNCIDGVFVGFRFGVSQFLNFKLFLIDE